MCTHFRRKSQHHLQKPREHRHSPLKCLLVRLPHAKHPQLPNLDNSILPLYIQSLDIGVKIEGDNGDERPQKSRSAVQHLQPPTINHKVEPDPQAIFFLARPDDHLAAEIAGITASRTITHFFKSTSYKNTRSEW